MDKMFNAVIRKMNQSGKKTKKTTHKAPADLYSESFKKGQGWASSDDEDDSDYEVNEKQKQSKRASVGRNKKQKSKVLSSEESEESESDSASASEDSDISDKPTSSRRAANKKSKKTVAKPKQTSSRPKRKVAVQNKKRRIESPASSPDEDSESNPEPTSSRRRASTSKKAAAEKPKQSSARSSRAKRSRLDSSTENGSSAKSNIPLTEGNLTLPALPVEVWAKIICYVLADVGTMPFLLRIARVATVFRDAAWNKICWRNVRLDAPKLTRSRECLEHFSESFIGYHTRQLSLSKWEEMTNEDLEMILLRTPNLTSLDISCCKALDMNDTIACLTNCAPKLRSLDLSYIHQLIGASKPIKAELFMQYLSSEAAVNLRYLYLNGNFIIPVEKLLESAASWTCAGELITLDMSGVNTGRSHGESGIISDVIIRRCSRPFDLSLLAKATPKLTTLRLAEVSLDYSSTTQLNDDGTDNTVWPLLESIDLSCEILLSQSSTMYASNGLSSTAQRPSYRLPGFQNILSLLTGSRHLRDVALSGIDGAGDLLKLLDDDLPLRQLYLRRCRLLAIIYKEELLTKFRKYLSTLVELDLGWINEANFDVFLDELFINFEGNGRLVKVNLVGCPISEEALQALVSKHKQLDWIDLTSSRSVPRGLKRVHSGAAAIRKLRSELKN